MSTTPHDPFVPHLLRPVDCSPEVMCERCLLWFGERGWDFVTSGYDTDPLRPWRIQAAYLAGREIVTAYDDLTLHAWLFGTNSHLDERAPILVLRETHDLDDLVEVVGSAMSFVWR